MLSFLNTRYSYVCTGFVYILLLFKLDPLPPHSILFLTTPIIGYVAYQAKPSETVFS